MKELQGKDKSVKSRFWLLVSFKPFPFMSGRKTGLSKSLGCAGVILRQLFWKFRSKLDVFSRLLACIQSSASCVYCTCGCLSPHLFGVCRSSSTHPVLHCSGISCSVTLWFPVLAPARGKAAATWLRQSFITVCNASSNCTFPPAQLSVLSKFSVSGSGKRRWYLG